MFVTYTVFPFNRRVTYSKSLNNARSESSIAINPRNPYNIVASSKRFTNPNKYEFSLAIYTTFDGGESWTEANPLKLLDGWAGVSDPALAWDVSQSTIQSSTTTTTTANSTKVCNTTTTIINDIV